MLGTTAESVAAASAEASAGHPAVALVERTRGDDGCDGECVVVAKSRTFRSFPSGQSPGSQSAASEAGAAPAVAAAARRRWKTLCVVVVTDDMIKRSMNESY